MIAHEGALCADLTKNKKGFFVFLIFPITFVKNELWKLSEISTNWLII